MTDARSAPAAETLPAAPAPDRQRLTRFAGTIAPGGAGMPAADAVALCREGGPVDRVLALRPGLAGPAAAAMAAAEPDPTSLARLERERPDAFAALVELVLSAYVLDPAVRRAIGYRGQEALALDRGRIGAEDALAEMMARAPFWRTAPETDADGPEGWR